jgi:hypothetical protein
VKKAIGLVAVVVLTGCFDVDVDADTFIYTKGEANVDIDGLDADAGIDPTGAIEDEITVLVEEVAVHSMAETVVAPGAKNVNMRSVIVSAERATNAVQLTMQVLTNKAAHGLDECRLHAWPALKKCTSATVLDDNGVTLTFEIDGKCLVEKDDAIVLDIDCDISADAKDGQTFDLRFTAFAGKQNNVPVPFKQIPGEEVPTVRVAKP